MPFNARQVREYAGGSIGGILRRGGSASASATSMSSSSGGTASYCGEAKQIDLLVFGYACKVFRDDDKAREIDQGKHLIPWMGDSSLKIDRYDVRGALYDLSPHEAPPGGYGNRLDYITAEEQRAEQLCEEERYLYLYRNEEQHILHQEEELKRFKQESSGYNQVGLQYNGDIVNSMAIPHGPNREDFSNSPTCEEADQVFTLPMNFVVPPSIQLPETMKQHAIIEKTARFIGSQGVQMEILLKAKQSNNLQFEFLTQNSTLNPYYKFVLNAIKDGSYPVMETTMESISDELTKEQEQQVALEAAALAERPVITVPTIKYKPSANCAYTQLISKIKGVPLPDVIDDHNSAVDAANKAATANANATNAITENEENFTPVLLQYNGLKYVTAAEESKGMDNNKTQDTTNSPPKVEILKNSSALLLAQGYSSGSDTESEAEKPPPKPEPKLTFPLPAENLRNIIDKTASYVIKNGRQFEETLRAKSEERFTFLLADNEYYPYYMYKITGDPDAASIEQKTRKAAAVAAALMSRKKLLTPTDKNAPVCFSIKAKDDQLTPGLPQENSDDDDENTHKPLNNNDAQLRSVPEHVKKAIQLVESQLMARNAQLAAAVGATAAVLPCNVPTSMRSRFDVDYNGQLTKPASSVAAITNAELERNAIFEQQQQNRHKELKRAEEKVKDKLAQIAREKLGGLISKEKQLQLERKRKAMAFLNQIKAVGAGQVHFGEVSNDIYAKARVYVDSMAGAQIELKGLPAAIVDEVGRVILKKSYPQEGCITIFQSLGSSENELTPDKKSTNDNGNASDNSDESVHSIPITSYGPEEKTDDEDEPPRLETTKPVFMPATRITKTPSPIPPPIVKKPEQKPIKITAAVTVSDDDDVELISETKAPPVAIAHKRKSQLLRKRHSRSRSRSRNRESYTSTKLQKRCIARDTSSESLEKPSHTTKQRSHKSAKTKKSSHKSHSKKKSKKRSRSRSRSPSQRRSKSHHSSRSHSTYRVSHSRYSRSISEESVESDISPPPPARTKRHHQHSKRSKEKRRKHER